MPTSDCVSRGTWGPTLFPVIRLFLGLCGPDMTLGGQKILLQKPNICTEHQHASY